MSSSAPVSPVSNVPQQLTPSDNRKKYTSPKGIEMVTYTTYQARLNVHPDHAGFVVGGRGSTIKTIGSKFKVDAKMNKGYNGKWPFVVIRGKMEGVEGAYLELQHIANIANQKIPRINQDGSVIPPSHHQGQPQGHQGQPQGHQGQPQGNQGHQDNEAHRAHLAHLLHLGYDGETPVQLMRTLVQENAHQSHQEKSRERPKYNSGPNHHKRPPSNNQLNMLDVANITVKTDKTE